MDNFTALNRWDRFRGWHGIVSGNVSEMLQRRNGPRYTYFS